MTNLNLRLRAVEKLDGGPWLKAKFLALSAIKRKELAPLLNASPPSLLARHLEERPEILGVVLWPYQCAAWNAAERVQRIVGHFDALERVPSVFQFRADDKLLLLDLSMYREGAKVILDQPRWLLREGHFALNIFDGNHRSYSLSASLYNDTVFIGGIQGRSTPNALEVYRDMTKDFHGLRPRDFLLDLLRMLSPILSFNKIHAVADQYRFFRHPYFRSGTETAMALDYDEIWKDRSGAQTSVTHFELPIKTIRRPLEEISSKKRGMYRKRYEMLDQLEERLHQDYADAPLVRFDAT